MFNTQILAGSSGQGGGEVQQSLKFNDDETQYLSWTPASAGNRKTWTWSGWVKRGNLSLQRIFTAGTSGTSYFQFRFDTNHNILLSSEQPSVVLYLETTQKFRDPSAWYHIVVAMDTTQSTAADRTKLYINGSLVTDFSSSTRPAQNTDLLINSTTAHMIGALSYGVTSGLYDGYLSNIHFIDGQALDATSFGQFTNGYWEKIDYAGTYGTNGFHLTFADDVVSEGFNTVTYRGTGATQSISGLGFSPDFVWVKVRDGTNNHRLFDVVRGATKDLISNSTSSESTTSVRLQSFDGDGFTVGTNAEVNASGGDIVAWCWDAGSGSPVSNTDGTITSTVKANPDYGFSIISYTGSSNTSFGHGLSSQPEMVLIKRRDSAAQWAVYHTGLSSTSYYLNLDDTGAEASYGSAFINPGSTTITIDANSSLLNANGGTYICYAFASVAGYSKFGSYTGSGISGNSITGLGFSPAWLMIKSSAGATNDWFIYDNTRQPTNPKDLELYANLSSAEYDSGRNVTFTNDGFDLDTVNYVNNSGVTYIYMAFADTREAAFWKDVSGQGNNWTPNNLDYRDSLPDSPANNWATFNPLSKALYQPTFSNGNLSLSVSAAWSGAAGTIGVTSGKWYWEIVNGSSDTFVGICADNLNFSVQDPQTLSGTILYYGGSGQKRVDGALTSYGAAFSTETIGVALDIDGGNITFYRNNVSQGSIPLSSSTLNGKTILPYFSKYASTIIVNFGQDSTFSGTKPMGAYTDDNSIGNFQYAPPTGYLALCTANLSTPTIVDGSEYFNTVLYTGDDSTQAITGVGFGSAPDLTWIKNRAAASTHRLYNSLTYGGPVSAGSTTNYLASNSTIAETASASTLISFDSDGFTVHGSGNDTNDLNETYASWNWKAGGTAVSNTDGSITSQVSANTTAGFSIASYTGNSTTGATVGHSLGVAPDMIIVKSRDNARDWRVYHSSLGATKALDLNTTNAVQGPSSAYWNSTDPTSSVFSIGNVTTVNGNNENYIAYCFANTDGYSKAGSYTGNTSTDGAFVYTGFRPAWVLWKSATSAGDDWFIVDSTRSTFNVVDTYLRASQTTAEQTFTLLDFVSNGFKLRASSGAVNDATTFIYLAFAETPFKYANAR